MMRGEIYSELAFKVVFLRPLNFARANTALVRTEQRLLVRVQGYLCGTTLSLCRKDIGGASSKDYPLVGSHAW